MNKDYQSLINEIDQLRAQIAEQEKLKVIFQAIMDHAPALISAKDLKGNVIIANKRFSVLEGPSPEEFVGKNVFDLFPLEIAEALWENDLRAAKENRAIESEEDVIHKDKSLHTYHTVKFPLIDRNNELFGTCAFSIDITNRKQAEENSIRDALTGLYNRRYFDERFESEMKRAERDNRLFVFL